MINGIKVQYSSVAEGNNLVKTHDKANGGVKNGGTRYI